jgi:hypothetical protein
MSERAQTIACLNDRLRTTLEGGRVLVTRGVQALGQDALQKIVAAVRHHSTFTEDNDPFGEHDFGVIQGCGPKIFWKIDYYDTALSMHSPNPADPAVTTRVLTILLAEEY